MTPANRGPGRPSNDRRAAGSRPERRGTTRPGTRAPVTPPAPGGRVAPPQGPRRGLTSRKIAVLAVLVAFLGIFLAPTVSAYLREQEETEALQRHVDEQRAEVGRLQKERDAWDDPAFVERQARERLRFVRPGERSYVVVNKDRVTRVVPTAGSTQQVAQPVDGSAPWYGELWQSVKVAAQGPPGTPVGEQPAPPAPAPSTAPTTTSPTQTTKATR